MDSELVPDTAISGVIVKPPTLRLFSDGLLSKWGFGDGDEPDQVWDSLDEQDIDYATFSWHPVLIQIVRRYLLPVLTQEVTVVEIETIHNPIRAETVNGVDVTDGWYDSSDSSVRLTPEFVDVPMSEVLRVALEVAGRG